MASIKDRSIGAGMGPRASRSARTGRIVAALVAAAALAACLPPEAQLVARHLTGQGFPTPAPVASPVAAAADPAALSVDFGSGATGSLTQLVPEVTIRQTVEDGWLKMRGAPVRGGWYSDRSGPMVQTLVSGPFMAETRVRAIKADAPTERPTGAFNSAGLLIRDPASAPAAMRWVMYNIGMQDGFYGTEAKSTVPELPGANPHRLAGFRSASTLWLTPLADGIVEMDLRMCRIGDEVRMYRRGVGETAWIEETRRADTVAQGNGLATPTPGVPAGEGPLRFAKTGLPDVVQVGLIVNPGMAPSDGEGRFRGLTLARVASFEDCSR